MAADENGNGDVGARAVERLLSGVARPKIVRELGGICKIARRPMCAYMRV